MTTDKVHQPGAPDPPTLKDDLSAKDLESVVAGICSVYGTVVKVLVHVSRAHLNVHAFAFVELSKTMEAKRLATAFKRRPMGMAVLLLLEPRRASAS